MVENQHKLIKGYRDLTQGEIDAMNIIKTRGEDLGLVIERMRATLSFDQRWVSIAEAHLQQGIMALVRAIAKPETF